MMRNQLLSFVSVVGVIIISSNYRWYSSYYYHHNYGWNSFFVSGFSITDYSSRIIIRRPQPQPRILEQQRTHFPSSSLSLLSKKNNRKQQYRDHRLYMIQNIFGGSGSSTSSSTSAVPPTLPRDVKEAITKCREATQNALQDRISRMDIDFPVGTKFGVEKNKSKNTRKQPKFNNDDSNMNNIPTKDEFDTSDRELARIFVEMFQPVGADKIVVTFNDINLADQAKQQWKDDSYFNDPICRVMSLDRRKSLSAAASKKAKKAISKPKGFAAKIAAEIETDSSSTSGSEAIGGPFQLPEGTEVAIFVAPGQKEIPIIEKVCASVGMGTLVILLNARKYSITNFGSSSATKLFTEEFQSIFHLGSVQPQDIAPGCLIYHTYNGPWIVARKPSVGQPKTILVTADKNRPTNDEIQTTYNNLEVSDIEKNVETAIENVAKWFR